MIQHLVYKCPKCQNTLLVSNKMLHDLKCTEENPATYENILSQQEQQVTNYISNYNPKSNPQSINNPNNYNPNENSSMRTSRRMSIKHDDGTMTDFRKEKNMRGKEELVEIKYDPQGNIISRKKADNSEFIDQLNNDYQEVTGFNDFVDYDPNEYYEVNEENERKYNNMNNNIIKNEITYNNNQIIYETAATQEIVYEAPPQYDPNITINQPIEETVVNSNGNLSHYTINNIIRNSMTRSNNLNNNLSNPFNNMNTNEFNYPSQENSINNIINSQIFNNSPGNNGIYNQGMGINNNNIYMGTGDILNGTEGLINNDFNNVQYPY